MPDRRRRAQLHPRQRFGGELLLGPEDIGHADHRDPQILVAFEDTQRCVAVVAGLVAECC
jgi:hypothetical protein